MGQDVSKQLYNAARQGNNEGAEQALRAGAKPDYRHNNKYTVVMTAARHNHPDTIRLLAQYRANLDLMDRNGDTAMHHAVRGFNMPCVSMLTSLRAHRGVINVKGQTPYELAMARGNPVAVRWLEELWMPVRSVCQIRQTFLGMINMSSFRWFVVERARPCDSPLLHRGPYRILFFKSRRSARPSEVLYNPRMLLKKRGTHSNEIELVSTQTKLQRPPKLPPCPLDRYAKTSLVIQAAPAVCDWMHTVMSPGFASGAAPVFEPRSGRVVEPAWMRFFNEHHDRLPRPAGGPLPPEVAAVIAGASGKATGTQSLQEAASSVMAAIGAGVMEAAASVAQQLGTPAQGAAGPPAPSAPPASATTAAAAAGGASATPHDPAAGDNPFANVGGPAKEASGADTDVDPFPSAPPPVDSDEEEDDPADVGQLPPVPPGCEPEAAPSAPSYVPAVHEPAPSAPPVGMGEDPTPKYEPKSAVVASGEPVEPASLDLGPPIDPTPSAPPSAVPNGVPVDEDDP